MLWRLLQIWFYSGNNLNPGLFFVEKRTFSDENVRKITLKCEHKKIGFNAMCCDDYINEFFFLKWWKASTTTQNYPHFHENTTKEKTLPWNEKQFSISLITWIKECCEILNVCLLVFGYMYFLNNAMKHTSVMLVACWHKSLRWEAVSRWLF